MSIIPEELLEQFERGNVLLLVGEGINQGVLPSSGELASELAARCDYPPEEPLSLARVASYYELTRDRHGLVRFLRERLLNATAFHTIPSRHQLISRLGVRVIITTCVDQLLGRALDEAKITYTPVVGNSEVAYSEEERLLLVYLWGVLEQPDSLIITQDDQRGFLDGRANLSDVLRGELAQRTWLFIGFDASDEWFCGFYEQVTRTLDRHSRRVYLLGSDLGAFARAWWHKQNAEVLNFESQPFLEQLTQELAARREPTPAIPSWLEEDESPLPLPERPYKFLDYYEAKDAAIFYGRQQETLQLCALIHAHRLVVLYGASGVGKTSLLLAGAVPRLERATSPYEAIHIRALDDPVRVIRRTLRHMLPDAELPHEGSLVEFLSAATLALGKTLVIILDQFEEFFIRLSSQFRAAFIAELGALYDVSDVPVKVVFSLREDWLASMDEIERRIPDLSRSVRMRLLRLTRQQAHEAITAPAERLEISYEPALLERLLDDLEGSDEEVMPPQLQLVCSALYDGRREHDRVLKVATYERLGGTKGVLRKYLEEKLARLEPAQQALARAILEELVTSERTKAVKRRGELALRLEVEPETLETVLKGLVQARLLRTVQDESGQSAYELAHEYLIDEISLTADTQARKQAEELIKQEVENWQRFGTVLGADKLALIGDVRDLLRLNDDAQALLLHSALQVGHDIEYWLHRISDSAQRIALLSEATDNKLPVMRQRAVQILGTQDIPPAVAPLLTAALHDSNLAVRDAARQSLAQLTQQHSAIVAQLISQVENTTGSTRAAALRTLTYLPLSGLPLPLRTQVLMMRIRLRITSLIQASVATSPRRAAMMTTGLLVISVALTYAFSANSYHVDTKPSPISTEPNILVIRQGHPRLLLPGLDNEIVNTGISTAELKDHEQTELKGRWGLWIQQSPDSYRKWGQDVTDVLHWEHRVQMLWYLGQQDEAVRAIVEATDQQSLRLRRHWLLMLAEVEATNSNVAAQIIEPLVELLDDSDNRVRIETADALAKLLITHPELAPQLIEPLLSLLNHPDSGVRASTAQAVGGVVIAKPELAEQLIEPLLGLLDDPDRYVRTSATQVVAEVLIAKPELAEQLIEPLLGLLGDSDWFVHSKAAQAVAEVLIAKPELATPQLIEPLLGLLDDPNSNVHGRAAQAVGQVLIAKPELAEQLIEPLLGLLDDPDSDVRDKVAQAVGEVVRAKPELAEQLIEPLSGLLDHPDSDVRARAAQAVGEVVRAKPELAEQLIEPLSGLLDYPDGYVRASATQALGEVVRAKPELAEQLIEQLLGLLDAPDSDVRDRAAQVLGEVLIAKPELAEQLIEPLLGLLDDPDLDVHDKATRAVEQIVTAKPEQYIEHLLTLLSHPAQNVRQEAASIIEKILTSNDQLASQHLEFLLTLLDDPDRAVRYDTAIIVLQVLSNNDQLALQYIESLLMLLDDQNLRVRQQVVSVMGEVLAGNSQLASQHIKYLVRELSHPDEQVRSNAILAVGQVLANDELLASQYIEQLLNLLSDSESSVRSRATVALGQVLANHMALAELHIDRLFILLSDSDQSVRDHAAYALAQVYIHQEQLRDEISNRLLAQLTHPLNTLERPFAAHALFLVALYNEAPPREEPVAIGGRLQTLSTSVEPIERIWANITLQMIGLADEAHLALKDEAQREQIRRQLHTYSDLPASDINFFGEEFAWAAGQAHNWLEE
ncbi:MAG: sister chromatid cohesion protein PDS5 [Ardenticatenaceae bacterium]